MRGRFGRRRRPSSSSEGRPAIESSWLERISQTGVVPVPALEADRPEGIPDSFALVAHGEAEGGRPWRVAVSPRSGTDALLAALAVSRRAAREEQFTGEVAAVSPVWSAADRRLLGALAAGPVNVRAVSLADASAASLDPSLAEAGAATPVPLERLAAQIPDPAERALFQRALEGLRGLAAKHGGAVRGSGRSAELVILARRVAALHAEGGARLETLLPSRSSARLDEASLADALDRLEGYVRKRLNEKGVRDGEEGLRGRGLSALREAASLRHIEAWPEPGRDLQRLDLAGVAADGTPVIGAIRERLDLVGLAEILEAAFSLEAVMPAVLASVEAPVKIGRPRLLLAVGEVEPAVEEALAGLALDVERFDLADLTAARPSAQARGSVAAGAAAARGASRDEEERPSRGRGSRRGGRSGRGRDAARGDRADRGDRDDREERAAPEGAADELQARGDEETEESGDSEARRGRRGGRRRRGRGAQRSGGSALAGGEDAPEGAGVSDGGGREAEAGFEEVSLFDLDDGEEGGDDAPRSRRRRGRRRARRGTEGSTSARSDSGPGGSEAAPRAEANADDHREDADEGPDDLPGLSPEAPEIEEDLESSYDEADLQEEPLTPGERMRLERERRRLARVAKTGPDTPGIAVNAVAGATPRPAEAVDEDEPQLLRGRAAILALADRDSVAAAVLLAREMRSIEGLWVYPEEELMTFFRSVCTDLRENTPIYVVGFVARPARDAIQAASLYRDRIVWFDHHEWPPEDLGALREAVGPTMVHVAEGCDSVLPLVVAQCTRRSRFTDKLVDLVTGRFTQHDFERWGRLWWSRLGDMAERPGDHRAAVESLLAGRPSDLAREAAKEPTPPPPAEVAWATERDFRLVHFGGFSMVVADVPRGLSTHLAGRVLRERYGAELSLVRQEGGEVFVLGTDESGGRRAIDTGAMVDHLDAKFGWVESLPQADHVARVRARLGDDAARLDELISEIAMGRSILEG